MEDEGRGGDGRYRPLFCKLMDPPLAITSYVPQGVIDKAVDRSRNAAACM